MNTIKENEYEEFTKKVILPIEIPISSTYMVPASEFALLQTTQTGKNYIRNRYIQMYMFGDILNHKTYDLGLSILTDPFEQNPCFITTKIESAHEYLLCEQKLNVIRCLCKGTYFYSYRYLNEFYISEARFYNKCNMLHMFLIYGYDADEKMFYTMGYDRRGVFTNIRIGFSEYDKSIENLDDREHRYIILINNNYKHVEKELNLESIKFWLDQYIKSKNSRIIQRGVYNEVAITDNLIFGYRIYDYILAYLFYYINKEVDIEKYDYRFSRQLLEHKKIMIERLKYMCKDNLIGEDILDHYIGVVDDASILHNLNTKFLILHNEEILRKVKERLMKMQDTERMILEKVMSYL